MYEISPSWQRGFINGYRDMSIIPAGLSFALLFFPFYITNPRLCLLFVVNLTLVVKTGSWNDISHDRANMVHFLLVCWTRLHESKAG